jgi:hypothetical protein
VRYRRHLLGRYSLVWRRPEELIVDGRVDHESPRLKPTR